MKGFGVAVLELMKGSYGVNVELRCGFLELFSRFDKPYGVGLGLWLGLTSVFMAKLSVNEII